MIKQLGSLVVGCLVLAGCSSAPPPEPDWPESVPLERGLEAYEQGHYANALRLLARAQHEFQLSDHRQGLLVTQLNLGEVQLRLEQPEAAAQSIQKAAALSHELAHAEAAERVALQRVRQLLLLENLSQAERVLNHYWPDAQQVSGEVEVKTLAAAQLWAALALAQDDLSVVGERLDGLSGARAQGSSERSVALHEARYLRLRADYGARQGEPEAELLAHWQAALDHYRHWEHRPGIAATLAELAAFKADQGDPEAAFDYAHRAGYIFAWSGQEKARQRMQDLQETLQPGVSTYNEH